MLGLALQNTLADVFSGLAINIERPFGAGDWITVSHDVEGQVIEINWRATRIRTVNNDLIVIPNSVVAKAIVTNHRRLNDALLCTVDLKIHHGEACARVIEILQSAASGCPGIATGTICTACAFGFDDALINYELTFAVDEFTQAPDVRSALIRRITDALQRVNVAVGTRTMEIELLSSGQPMQAQPAKAS